jgi:hypothetical protein
VRTTLTIDDDVAAALEDLRRTRSKPFKALVNEALREGIRQMRAPPAQRKRFATRAVDLGLLRIGSLDNVADALAIAEGESFR